MLRRILQKLQKLGTPKIEPQNVIVTFHQNDQKHEIHTRSGKSILSIAKEHDLDIPHYCGGCCRCGTCSVEIIHGNAQISPLRGNESMVLGLEKSEKNHRLACQAIVNGNLEVRIPEWF